MRAVSTCDESVQLARDPKARQRRVGHQAQALPCVVVDHRQDPEPSSVGQRVADEVERPALVRTLWQDHRCPCAQGPLASTTPANLQSLLDVEPPQLLVVEVHALARQQHMQPSPAKAQILRWALIMRWKIKAEK